MTKVNQIQGYTSSFLSEILSLNFSKNFIFSHKTLRTAVEILNVHLPHMYKYKVLVHIFFIQPSLFKTSR